MNTIGIVAVAAFAACAARPFAGNHGDVTANQFGGQCWQPIVLTLREAVFDRYVLALDVAGFFQALAERGQKVWIIAGRPAVEETDYRYWRMLCAGS